jgi:taurine dioxygenase
MQVTPITPIIGAEVTGADLTNLTDETFASLRSAFTEYSVLIFRDQPELTPEQQVTFAKRFGPLHTHPAAPTLADHPEVFVIHAHAESKVANGHGWHTDVSCDEEPPMATLLQLHTLPPTGGDTLFSSTYAAFETLSPTMQEFLLLLRAHHESEHIYRGRYSDRGVDDRNRQYPRALHPVVRTHPDSGRKALYVNPSFTTRIDGLSREESDGILKILYSHQQRPEFQMRLQWQPNTIAMWDNRCTLHFALWDYWPSERKGNRVTVLGERPYLDDTPATHTKMRLAVTLSSS